MRSGKETSASRSYLSLCRKKIKLEPEPDEGDCAGVGEASVKEDPEAHTRSRAVGRLPNSLLYPGTVVLAQVLKLFISYGAQKSIDFRGPTPSHFPSLWS